MMPHSGPCSFWPRLEVPRVFRHSLRTAVVAAFVFAAVSFAANRPSASSEAQTGRYFDSIRKDPNLLVAFLLEMPKGGDLHNHLSGAIYAETLIDWAKEKRASADHTSA